MRSRRWASTALRSGLLFALASVPAQAGGLLDGLAPTRADGVWQPARLTDGRWETESAGWQSPGAVQLPEQGFVEWDLGRSEPIIGATLQGDNNDDYVLWVSEDDQSFAPVWHSGTKAAPGLQTRSAQPFQARGRYVRLTSEGGDGRFSVSEVELFSTRAQVFRSWLERALPSHPLDPAWALGLLATLAVLIAVERRSRPVVVWSGAAVLVATLAWLVKRTVLDVPGVDPSRLNWMRAMVAAIAWVAIARERLFIHRRPAHHGLVLGVLAATAGLGLLCFVNLGRPQFFDAGAGRTTFLHHYDMRTYFPIARYFPELRFDGVYAASAMAVADERGGVDAVANLGLRDLRTHQWTNAGAVRDHLLEVRARFSPARWALFVEDMRYFRRAMGDDGFLGSMIDHGGNATPVWLLTAHAVFGGAASDRALWFGVELDALLMLLAFSSLAWAFGPRTALVGMTVFGAMDFYMFGTNWFGAALRHDWLALWCLGLSMLKKKHFALAGAFLAWAALIRAFPALTFATLTIPAGWDAAVGLLRRDFSLRAWRARHADLFRVALGAGTATGALVGLSVIVFGASAWTEWFHKVALLNSGNYINNLAVKTLLAANVWAWGVTVVGSCLLVVFVARRAPLFEAAAWGVTLLPVVFNPANYYLQSVFLLVVLADEQRDGVPARSALTWLALLAMCFASFFTSLAPDQPTHFGLDTGVLLATLGLVAVVKLVASFRPAPEPLTSIPIEAPAADVGAVRVGD